MKADLGKINIARQGLDRYLLVMFNWIVGIGNMWQIKLMFKYELFTVGLFKNSL